MGWYRKSISGITVFRAHPDAPGQASHREPERLEHGCEEPVLLEAVAATAVRNQFRLKARQVECDRTAKQHVEVLERDAQRVCQVQTLQGP